MGQSNIRLSLAGIGKTYPVDKAPAFTAVADITLDVRENEFLVVLGPGHCGKTVMLNMIAGLEKPTCGSICLDGKELEEDGSPEISMVFQKLALMPWKTVLQNVEVGLKFRGEKKAARRKKARHYIDMVGLRGFEDAYPHQLSGGMKQRVGIARAYATDPQILLMDEPFGQLDAQTRYAMEEEIIRIWQQEKRTIVFVTSNIEEAIYLGDRIVLLSECPATVKELYDIAIPRPRDQISEEFLKLRAMISNNTDLAI